MKNEYEGITIQDEKTTVEDLGELIKNYRMSYRLDIWDTVKDLCAAISIESAELLELTLFESEEDIRDEITDVKKELADVLIYCIALSNYLDIDITSAIQEKIEYNIKRGKSYDKNYIERMP